MNITIIQSDYFNALYENGTLKSSGKPCYLDAETLALTFPEARFFTAPQDLCAEVLDGLDYPRELADFPLERCTRIR